MRKDLKSNPGLSCFSLAALMLVTGCASPRPPSPERMPLVQQFSAKGYLSEDEYSLTTTPLSWVRGEHRYDILLSLPTRQGTYPLIIYLPGWGETRNGGEAWRNTWARAGYAVLSVQLLEEDALIGQTPPRAGAAAAAVGRRQFALGGLLDELQQRQAHEPLLAQVDLDSIVLAGFDLGAQTASIAAAQHRAAGLAAKAVILLSPRARQTVRAAGQEDGGLGLPLLSVNGRGDDALGAIVAGTAARRSHYLLTLEDSDQALLGGGPRQAQAGETEDNGMGWGINQSAVKAVTTAFLDQQVKHNALAAEWLRRDARRWLRARAELTLG